MHELKLTSRKISFLRLEISMYFFNQKNYQILSGSIHRPYAINSDWQESVNFVQTDVIDFRYICLPPLQYNIPIIFYLSAISHTHIKGC